MSLDENTVRHVAKLARLGIAESEINQYQQDLANILELVDQLQSVDTADVTPLAHPIEMTPTYRQDIVSEHEQRDHLQSVAPEVESGLYLVPRVVE